MPVSGLGSRELGEAVSRVIAPLVPHDGLRLVGSGPSARTGIGSFGFAHGYEPDFGRALYHGIAMGEDPFPLPVLEKLKVPGAVVGNNRTFGRYGVGCELRVALRTPRGLWGSVGLLRAANVKPFTEDDTVAVASLISPLVALMRRFVTAAPLVPSGRAPGTGVALVGPDHRIRAATPEAQRWLDILHDDHAGPEWTIESGISIISMLARTPGAEPPVIVGPAAGHGWLGLQAQLLGDDVAIITEQASGEMVLPAFGDWYGLTPRERDVVARLYRAAAPKQIARQLDLSVYTVNEHLKAVYRKTGASSRDELVAALAG